MDQNEKPKVEMSEDMLGKYCDVFDDRCPEWDRNPYYNVQYLCYMQMWCNETLRHDGFITLYEVLKRIGIPIRDKAMAFKVGWIYDENNPIGDNYIDFGIKAKDDFVQLNFNVDGEILDRL